MQQDSKVSEITDKQLLELDRRCTEWLQVVTSNVPTDKTETAAAIKDLYETWGLTSPIILWCQSTWQMKVFPIVIAVLRRSQFLRQSLPKLTFQDDEKWRTLWLQLAQLNLDDFNRIHLSILGDSRDFGPSKELSQKLPDGFNESARSQLRNKYELQFRNRLHDNQIEFLAVDRRFLDLDRLLDEVAFQLTGVARPESTDAVTNLCQILDLETCAFDHTVQLHPFRTRAWWGVYSLPRLPLVQFVCDLFDIPTSRWVNQDEIRALCNLSRYAAGYSFYAPCCLVCQRPVEKHIDERGSAHNENGPAATFSDGYKIYSWHGITVPQWLITAPEKISAATIIDERNSEVRRAMIERLGMAQFLAESGAKVAHRDEFGILYVQTLPYEREEVVIVRVINSTPEPDGTYKEYFLRVPPHITTARAAVAWTFGLTAEEYEPVRQT